jgi:hypothetical protein
MVDLDAREDPRDQALESIHQPIDPLEDHPLSSFHSHRLSTGRLATDTERLAGFTIQGPSRA